MRFSFHGYRLLDHQLPITGLPVAVTDTGFAGIIRATVTDYGYRLRVYQLPVPVTRVPITSIPNYGYRSRGTGSGYRLRGTDRGISSTGHGYIGYVYRLWAPVTGINYRYRLRVVRSCTGTGIVTGDGYGLRVPDTDTPPPSSDFSHRMGRARVADSRADAYFGVGVFLRVKGKHVWVGLA